MGGDRLTLPLSVNSVTASEFLGHSARLLAGSDLLHRTSVVALALTSPLCLEWGSSVGVSLCIVAFDGHGLALPSICCWVRNLRQLGLVGFRCLRHMRFTTQELLPYWLLRVLG